MHCSCSRSLSISRHCCCCCRHSRSSCRSCSSRCSLCCFRSSQRLLHSLHACRSCSICSLHFVVAPSWASQRFLAFSSAIFVCWYLTLKTEKFMVLVHSQCLLETEKINNWKYIHHSWAEAPKPSTTVTTTSYSFPRTFPTTTPSAIKIMFIMGPTIQLLMDL